MVVQSDLGVNHSPVKLIINVRVNNRVTKIRILIISNGSVFKNNNFQGLRLKECKSTAMDSCWNPTSKNNFFIFSPLFYYLDKFFDSPFASNFLHTIHLERNSGPSLLTLQDQVTIKEVKFEGNTFKEDTFLTNFLPNNTFIILSFNLYSLSTSSFNEIKPYFLVFSTFHPNDLLLQIIFRLHRFIIERYNLSFFYIFQQTLFVFV